VASVRRTVALQRCLLHKQHNSMEQPALPYSGTCIHLGLGLTCRRTPHQQRNGCALHGQVQQRRLGRAQGCQLLDVQQRDLLEEGVGVNSGNQHVRPAALDMHQHDPKTAKRPLRKGMVERSHLHAEACSLVAMDHSAQHTLAAPQPAPPLLTGRRSTTAALAMVPHPRSSSCRVTLSPSMTKGRRPAFTNRIRADSQGRTDR